jgi:hypothetical protein
LIGSDIKGWNVNTNGKVLSGFNVLNANTSHKRTRNNGTFSKTTNEKSGKGSVNYSKFRP